MSEVLTEPRIGEIRKGREIGKHPTNYYIYRACVDCGKERWIHHRKDNELNKRCKRCANKLHSWKGGRKVNTQGYIELYIKPEDFFYSMIKPSGHGDYIREHRLVMAKHLGRPLQRWEHVHHKNGIKDDNRIENLELTTNGQHHISHHKGYKDGFAKGLVDGKNTKIKILEAQIAELEHLLLN